MTAAPDWPDEDPRPPRRGVWPVVLVVLLLAAAVLVPVIVDQVARDRTSLADPAQADRVPAVGQLLVQTSPSPSPSTDPGAATATAEPTPATASGPSLTPLDPSASASPSASPSPTATPSTTPATRAPATSTGPTPPGFQRPALRFASVGACHQVADGRWVVAFTFTARGVFYEFAWDDGGPSHRTGTQVGARNKPSAVSHVGEATVTFGGPPPADGTPFTARFSEVAGPPGGRSGSDTYSSDAVAGVAGCS